jgi:hypothetical protein
MHFYFVRNESFAVVHVSVYYFHFLSSPLLAPPAQFPYVITCLLLFIYLFIFLQKKSRIREIILLLTKSIEMKMLTASMNITKEIRQIL